MVYLLGNRGTIIIEDTVQMMLVMVVIFLQVKVAIFYEFPSPCLGVFVSPNRNSPFSVKSAIDQYSRPYHNRSKKKPRTGQLP
jgi:hypothetical protein